MIFMDLKGTTNQTFQIQKGGVKLKNVSGEMLIVAANGTTPANLVADVLKATANEIQINSDGTGGPDDFIYHIKRPALGMTADVDFILPIDDGNNMEVLTTDGSGTLSWQAPTVPSALQVDVTDVLFGSAVSPANIPMFTLPANAIVDEVKFIVDVAWDGAPTLKVGSVANGLNRYMDTSDVDLTSGAADAWTAHTNPVPLGVTEAVVATYVKGGATIVGAAGRILTKYVIPS